MLGDGIREHASESAGGGDQRSGLPTDHLEVAVFVLLEAAGGVDLADLPVTQDRDRPREQAAHVRAQIGRHLRRQREQVVAREDRDGVVPSRVRRRDATPVGRFVDHVVVVQRREVRELDRHRAGDQSGVGGVPEVPRQQHEHRPEPFAARLQEVPSGRGEQVRVGGDRLLQLLLDAIQTGRDLRLERVVGALQPGDHPSHPITTSRSTPVPRSRSRSRGRRRGPRSRSQAHPPRYAAWRPRPTRSPRRAPACTCTR